MAEENLEEKNDSEVIDREETVIDTIKSFIQNNQIISQYLTLKNSLIAAAILLVFTFTLIFIPKLLAPKSQKKVPAVNAQVGKAYVNPTTKQKVKKKKQRKKRVKYKVMFRQLTPSQMTEATRELSIQEIDFDVIQNGRQFDLAVDENYFTDAKNMLAIRGIPSSSVKGFAIFDEASNLGATEFDKRIQLQRALSGEMELAITQFEAIDDAQVKLVMPEQRLFDTTEIPVTASVLIRPSKEHVLTDSVIYAIIRLISNGIENLDEKNISVVDTYGRLLSQGIFERLKLKKEQSPLDIPVAKLKEEPKDSVIPINPKQSLDEWLQVKKSYEDLMLQKMMEQLNIFLPKNSYISLISSDFETIKNGVPDIKKLSVSITLDKANSELAFDATLKQKIFKTISLAIPYVKGRDTIQLSLENLNLSVDKDTKKVIKNEQDSPEETTVTLEEKKEQQLNENKKLNFLSFFKYWPVFLSGLVLTFILYGFLFIVRRFRASKKPTIDDMDVFETEGLVDSPLSDSNVKKDTKTKLLQTIEQQSAIPKSLWTPSTLGLISKVSDLIDKDPEQFADFINALLEEEFVSE